MSQFTPLSGYPQVLARGDNRVPWTTQPQHPVALTPPFARPNCGAFLPSVGWIVPALGAVTQSVTNAAYTDVRFPVTSYGRSLRVYADDFGNDDDQFVWPKTIPSAAAGAFTTVLVLTGISTGNYQWVTRDSGHLLAIGNGDDPSYLASGYYGGNGSNYYYEGSLSGLDTYTGRHTFVISTKPGALTIVHNGQIVTPNNGFPQWVGDGSLAATCIPDISGVPYTNYYHFNGHVYLWACLPGVFLAESAALEVSVNPWSLFAPLPA